MSYKSHGESFVNVPFLECVGKQASGCWDHRLCFEFVCYNLKAFFKGDTQGSCLCTKSVAMERFVLNHITVLGAGNLGYQLISFQKPHVLSDKRNKNMHSTHFCHQRTILKAFFLHCMYQETILHSKIHSSFLLQKLVTAVLLTVYHLSFSAISTSKFTSMLHFSFPPKYLLLAPLESFPFSMCSVLGEQFNTVRLYCECLLLTRSLKREGGGCPNIKTWAVLEKLNDCSNNVKSVSVHIFRYIKVGKVQFVLF